MHGNKKGRYQAYRAYKNIRKVGIIAINLDEDDELAWVWLTDGSDQIFVATKQGKGIRFNENDARPLGRTARGVKAIELSEDDEVVGMCAVKKEGEDGKIFTVSESGIGRLTDPYEFSLQSRGGKGKKNYQSDKYGAVAGIALVHEDEDIILISSDGIVIRVAADDIRISSRTARGVKVMRVSEGERVVSASAVAKDDSEEKAEITEEAEEESVQAQETEKQ